MNPPKAQIVEQIFEIPGEMLVWFKELVERVPRTEKTRDLISTKYYSRVLRTREEKARTFCSTLKREEASYEHRLSSFREDLDINPRIPRNNRRSNDRLGSRDVPPDLARLGGSARLPVYPD